MYKVNGVSLHNPAHGWTVLDSSEWTAAATIARPSLAIPGIPGSIPLPGTQETPALGLVIGTRYSRLAHLKTLFAQPELHLERAGTPGTALVQVQGTADTRVSAGEDPEYELKVILSIPGVFFRGDTEESEFELTGSTATTVRPFPGITGLVNDALFRLTEVTDPKVQDSAGTFMAYTGTVNAGQYLVMDAGTGAARLLTGPGWTGGTEVDPLMLSYGRGPAFLTVTPVLGEDLSSTTARLSVTYRNHGAGASLAIRGRSAHLV